MDVIKLKTLTEKSILDFGKYSGMSVQQLLNLGYFPYLRWCYYNLSRISFTDEILKKIRIFSEKFDGRITKPGKDPEYYKKKEKFMFSAMCHEIGVVKTLSIMKKKRKIYGIKASIRDKRKFKKGKMQAINQGHH